MKRYLIRIIIVSALAISWSSSASADWKADIGYNSLQSELGANLPTGAGVNVTQVEAYSGGAYLPGAGSEFTGKTFTPVLTPSNVSAHATTVASYFYGNYSSIAPGMTNISCYEDTNWTGWGFLEDLYYTPLSSSSRVANHSWVSNTDTNTVIKILSRLDWVASQDEYFQVVAMNGPLLGSSFNGISVGLSNGGNAHGAYALTTNPTTPYASGARTKPDIVAPAGATSWSTPMVASAAALLVETGHRTPSLSSDPFSESTVSRNGDTIYNTERSETVKAALLAGASRTSSNLGSRYSVNTENGLNNILGAGELNILNSYYILAGGEQNSHEDAPSHNGQISSHGFDYDPQFGGSSSSNRTGTYVFKALSDGTLSASLAWNLTVAGGETDNFDTTATLNNLSLYLYDTTASTEVSHYASTVDNTQNIWTNLVPNHDYMLQVKAETPDSFLWDYALAWNSTTEFTSPGPPPTYSKEDLNQDLKTDATDFNILKADFLKITANLTNPRSDINQDGQATIKDVGILMSGWR